MSADSSSNSKFDTPEHAVESLLSAYRSRDIDAMVAAKDFAIDSRLFWEDLGLPVTDKQKTESVAAFESNFRKQMEQEGIPDYTGIEFHFTGRDQLQENLVVLRLACSYPQERRRFEMKLPVFKTASGWRVVRLPGYDHP
jgi:hypothetical protein